MKLLPLLIVLNASALVLASPGSARAQSLSLPNRSTGNCSSADTAGPFQMLNCFRITNTSTQNGAVTAITGYVPNLGGVGVQGVSPTGTGVWGNADEGWGVLGSTETGVAVRGFSRFGTAVYGEAQLAGLAGHFVGDVLATGTITPGPSDVRLKKNVKPLTGALDRLLKLRGVTYEWNQPKDQANQTGTQRGFIAQEVEAVLPEWIGRDPRGFKTISIPGRGLEAMLVESIRTLKKDNDELRQRLDKLEGGRSGSAYRLLSPGLGAAAAAGFLPLGLLFALRRRRNK
jgi:hypothetical protein